VVRDRRVGIGSSGTWPNKSAASASGTSGIA
jgi:hypothetical protein